ncbi:MAG: heavy-metal-associated domain-containing protein [Planctomycetes bacterium]|nr:heavy-metal-associated domain-containing protein [Planctomycetota bacterium]
MTLRISISGMHCDHCVRTVDEALTGLAGVSKCAVEIGRAEVVVNDAVTGRRDLFAAIRAAGAFEVRGFVVVDQPA